MSANFRKLTDTPTRQDIAYLGVPYDPVLDRVMSRDCIYYASRDMLPALKDAPAELLKFIEDNLDEGGELSFTVAH